MLRDWCNQTHSPLEPDAQRHTNPKLNPNWIPTMKCPTCPDSMLIMSDRQGVEIDYCPACRGIWLDRGELDKILDRAAANSAAVTAPVAASAPQPARAAQPYRQPDFDDSDYGKRNQYHHGRKKSWLNEIFD